VIADNDPEEQEKIVKFSTLLTNVVIFHTTLDHHRGGPGDLVHRDAPFGPQLFDVAVGQAVAQVPAHRYHDHSRWKTEPREPGLRRTY
jgi:hypothetical protein